MTQVQTVNQKVIQKMAAEIDTKTKGNENLTELKKSAKDVLKHSAQIVKEHKENSTTSSNYELPIVTTAELRHALAKLMAAYIKSTGETGDVLFGQAGTANKGIVGAEMNMGFSSADSAKDAMEAQASGMITAGCFSIAAGCMAMGGGAMGASATGEAAEASSALDAVPETAEAAAPETSASADASSDAAGGTSDGTEGLDEVDLEPVVEGSEVDPANADPEKETVQGKLVERAEKELAAKPDSSDVNETMDTETDNVEAQVNKSEQSMSKDEKDIERRKINEKKEKKQSYAQGLTMGSGLAQGTGSVTQAQFTQQQGTADQASKTLQTAAQTLNTTEQQAAKQFDTEQSGVQAVAQTMDLVNQTVVASSRI